MHVKVCVCVRMFILLKATSYILIVCLGLRTRILNCILEDGNGDTLSVPLKYCDLGNLTTVSESCDPPCPDDCVLSDYDTWSTCSKSCGIDAFKIRRRKTIKRANMYGRPCPEKAQLTQVDVLLSLKLLNFHVIVLYTLNASVTHSLLKCFVYFLH